MLMLVCIVLAQTLLRSKWIEHLNMSVFFLSLFVLYCGNISCYQPFTFKVLDGIFFVFLILNIVYELCLGCIWTWVVCETMHLGGK